MDTKRINEITNEVRVLKYMRIQAGLSLRKAGLLLRITDGAIGHLENGRMLLPAGRIEQMVTAYGFTMNEFFTLSRSKKIPDNRREECLQVLKVIPNSKLEDAFTYLNSLRKGL